MTLYTVEVAGRPVLVFSEETRDSAEELVNSLIGQDLKEFESGGAPLWDGTAALTVREAGEAETTRWEEGLEEAREGGSIGDDAEEFAVFLVPLDEEDEEEDEDEDDEEA
ncbi:hypothetical protein [Paracraurococcus lichenis]|uniref:Uncharacterized protein n=1 Tax=Paracraurococcus lichenis TaxID=3064888 RepID=A0ABT9E262_9PROT|nr:hypothetical protein [Paracraurococcus sp. LOR1-02]MDO9710258.1 hypothetical protein [Paracraurococcus sp. LOR1-02]